MIEAAAPDELPAEKPGHNLRGAILWTAGILLALALAWFVGTVVVPIWQVHRALKGRSSSVWVARTIRKTAFFENSHSGGGTWLPENLREELGGKENAAKQLRVYLAMPRRLAPKRVEAICVLGACGAHGVRPLIRQLSSTAADMRCAAACALGEIGSEATEAIPFLELLAKDPDGDTQVAAEVAISRIR
jgi:hypothetical protein